MAIRCPGCGKFLSAKDKICANCGTILGEPEEKPVENEQVEEEEFEEYELPKDVKASEAPAVIRPDAGPIILTKYQNVYVKEPADVSGPSYFDGKFHQLLGWSLLGALVTFFTLGICFPIAYAWLVKWEAKHTVICGYREQFIGKGGTLIGWWLLWSLLTLITLGIFGWWTPIRLRRWKVKRLILIEDPRRYE